MVTVVTLNPCIDKTIYVNRFKTNSTNKITYARSDIGGKGINVSLVLKTLGCDNTNLLIDYTVGNNLISDFLNSHKVITNSIYCSNSLRTNIKIIETSSGTMTELNDKGLPLPNELIDEFLTQFEKMLDSTTVLVLSGSIPPGVSADIYQKMISSAKSKNIITILDTSSSALELGINAKPTMIKPNLQELQEYTGCNIMSNESIIKAANELVKNGIEYVCVSDGENGAYLISSNSAYFTRGATINAISPQGAGDSMVAAFAEGFNNKRPIEEMFINAVAAAQATVIREGTQLCTFDDFIRIKNVVKLNSLNEIDNNI